jgi:acyl-CoA hydrolase
VPLSYIEIAEYLAKSGLIDVAIVQVTAPDAAGRVSFGLCADFGPIVWRSAQRRVAYVNRSLLRPRRGPSVKLEDADLVIECDGDVITAPAVPLDSDVLAAARQACSLIPNGAVLQTGIGGAPSAVPAFLCGHSGLRLHSGIIGQRHLDLLRSGALASCRGHKVGLAFGGEDLYTFAAADERLEFVDVTVTHDEAKLAAIPRFFAINSAVSVDLFGQANVEWVSDRLVSGVGGAPNFARGATRSSGGQSIIVLPSMANRTSRIVDRLTTPTISLARTDVDAVVTEFGAALLRGRSLDERAQALNVIAHPSVRDDLAAQWKQVRAAL